MFETFEHILLTIFLYCKQYIILLIIIVCVHASKFKILLRYHLEACTFDDGYFTLNYLYSKRNKHNISSTMTCIDTQNSLHVFSGQPDVKLGVFEVRRRRQVWRQQLGCVLLSVTANCAKRVLPETYRRGQKFA